MLKRFSVEGFKNFDFPLVLDFSNNGKYTFGRDCISNGLIKIMIIYGQNAVGKSNLGFAIFDLVNHLVDKNVSPNLYDYYINNSGKYACATFCYNFEFENETIEYKYKKTDTTSIIYEKLIVNDELLFEIDEEKKMYHYAQQLKDVRFDRVGSKASTLRFLMNFENSLGSVHVINNLYDFVTNMLWFRNLDQHRFIGLKDSVQGARDYYDFIFEGNNLEEFQELLTAAGVRDELVEKINPDGESHLYIKGRSLLPFFRVASNGTKALYEYFYWLKNKDISFLFIDEFDAYYHYELSEYIVKQLEKRDSQTILTSHNTNLMSNSIMRPDCYFILTPYSLTSFANATTRELREGHNLEKLYKNGEFGVK